MQNWKSFKENLELNNKKCPECGEKDKLRELGPVDYKRNEIGDYRRTMGYYCMVCNTTFNVDKKD